MHARQLDQKVTIQQATETQDASGAVVQTWSAFAVVWARIEALRGREYFDNQVAQADLSHKVTIRHLANVVPKMRILYGSRVLEIVTVMDDTDRRTWLTVMCEERDV